MFIYSSVIALALMNSLQDYREKMIIFPNFRQDAIAIKNQSRVMREKSEIQLAKAQEHIDLMTVVICEVHAKYENLDKATTKDLQKLATAEQAIQFSQRYIDFLKNNPMLDANDRHKINR